LIRTYRDFAELTLRAEKDQDYAVIIRDRSAAVTVAAIRGGMIDPPTSQLADAIASDDCNLYDLRGLEASQSESMRIPIVRFDDVRLRTLMERSEVGIVLMGAQDEGDTVHLGGSNRLLKRLMSEQLSSRGFATAPPSAPGPAHSPARVTNRPAQGGVQIELGASLRQSMVFEALSDMTWQNSQTWTDRFRDFVEAARRAIADYTIQIDTDLERTLDRFERTTRQVHKVIPPSFHDHHRNP